MCFYQTFTFLLIPTYLLFILRTGVHSVADVFCLGCNERLGWFYHKAADNLQKYKEGTYILSCVCRVYFSFYYLTEIWPGKFLLEREKLVKENAWTLDDDTTTTTTAD